MSLVPRRRAPRHRYEHLPFIGRVTEDQPAWLRKADSPCCQARALADGRPVIGWCGEDCLRRLERRTWTEREGQ